MKIKEFIKNTNINEVTLSTDENIVSSKYIPVEKKRAIARDILDRCIDDMNGFVTVNEIDREIYFTVSALEGYTVLEFSSDYASIVEEYDALYESGWLDVIPDLIGKDIKTLIEVLDHEEKTLLSRNSIEAQVANVANSLVRAIDGLSEKLEGVVGDFDMKKFIPEGTDVTELLDFISKLK